MFSRIVVYPLDFYFPLFCGFDDGVDQATCGLPIREVPDDFYMTDFISDKAVELIEAQMDPRAASEEEMMEPSITESLTCRAS